MNKLLKTRNLFSSLKKSKVKILLFDHREKVINLKNTLLMKKKLDLLSQHAFFLPYILSIHNFI